MHYFSVFSTKFNKACVNFSIVRTKNTLLENFENYWWKFNRKSEFILLFLENVTNKFSKNNRTFGNYSVFLQQFFRLRGNSPPPFSPPLATPLIRTTNNKTIWKKNKSSARSEKHRMISIISELGREFCFFERSLLLIQVHGEEQSGRERSI